MKTLILGGIKSGKSRLAETLAASSNKPVTIIATATAEDNEMQARIKHHQQSRPSHWQVIEEPLSLASALHQPINNNHCIIIDCLTLWITNLLLADDKSLLQKEKQAFIDSLTVTNGSVIMVSNETSMGIIPLGDLTRRFCDETGILHQKIAQQCDNVFLTIAGLPMVLKGSINYD